MVGDRIARQAVISDGNLLQAIIVPSHAAFDGGAKVLPEMEAVGNLNRFRGTGAGAVGVRTAPVRADDLGAGMFT
ncbi:hypothetical protein ACFRQM_45725 [Streptomyces sp. NPDC056831]|uniref:hypothetical protein n=1 Tax=Streptomyces sp. NPDC056831 TaxID=3345954 RepID=UPI0036BA53BD